MKTCSRCGTLKPLGEYYRHSGTRDGLKTYCKPCGRAASGAYYRDHAAEQNAKSSAKYRANTATKAAYDRAYRASHNARIAEGKRAYAARRRAEGWRRTYSDAERQRVQVRSARWYATHSERVRRRVSIYRRANSAKHVAWGEAYRARRRAAGGGVSAQQWLGLCAAYGHRCLACGRTRRLSMDHVQPLSVGGVHELRNVQPLCRSCNSRKQRRIIDYRPAGWEQIVAELGAGRTQQLGSTAAALFG